MLPKFKRLRGIMYENQISQEDLSRLLGHSCAYVSLRMTGKQAFDMDDVYTICDYFEIPYADMHLYFPPGGIEQQKKVG